MEVLKKQVRKILCFILWNGYYQFARNSWDVARNGEPLKDGITAVVSAKNEEYIIYYCLRSLVGVVDQVVCIDNGSDDTTLQVMRSFKEEFGDKIEVDILEMPGALLGDCRNAGLDATRYKWHLRWDADMICKTSGKEDMRQLRERAMKNDRPRTIQLPRTNLRGDFEHTRKFLPAIDPGEPILVRFGKDVTYVEYGKFDAIRVPFYYAIEKDKLRYYFHCEGLKSDENLIHRRQYFDWRESYNKHVDGSRPERIEKFDLFKIDWNDRVFGTSETLSLKWRFQREFCNRLVRIDKELFGEYPETLLPEVGSKTPRFKVILKDGVPYSRIDSKDDLMANYQPSEEDLAWEAKLLS